jgi:hypothetical protein
MMHGHALSARASARVPAVATPAALAADTSSGAAFSSTAISAAVLVAM